MRDQDERCTGRKSRIIDRWLPNPSAYAAQNAASRACVGFDAKACSAMSTSADERQVQRYTSAITACVQKVYENASRSAAATPLRMVPVTAAAAT